MKIAPLLSAFATAGLAGCSAAPPPGPAGDAVPPIAVSVASIESVELPSYLEAGGVVQAGATAYVTSRVVAPILEIHVRAGDPVTAGQRIVTLDARELAANATRAAASLVAATESSRAAESRVAAAEAGLRLAAATHARISGLHERRSATPQELDQAVAALGAADAAVQTARAERTAAQAARDAAAAAAEAASIARSYATLTSPYDGRVADRLADPGSLASPGTPLVVVERSGRTRLEVRLDESRAGSIAIGQQAEVRLDSDAASTWMPAQVVEVGRADPASHSFLAKLELPEGVSARSGAFGRARFAGAARRTLVTPSVSLIRRGGLTFVFAVSADNRARLRPVVAGAVAGDRTEVLAGVKAGEVVILHPPPSLADGAGVTPEAGAREGRR